MLSETGSQNKSPLHIRGGLIRPPRLESIQLYSETGRLHQLDDYVGIVTTILGISAFYHDSAAALVIDGQIKAAAQEERFTRRKHDASFPNHAVRYCLSEVHSSIEQIDHVVFYDKPLKKFDRLIETYLSTAPKGITSFVEAIPVWLREKLYTRNTIRRHLAARRKPILFTEHHESHAASAFYPSPFDEAAVLTLDGVGEWATTVSGVGRGNRLHLDREIRFPHSLGLLYSAFTYYCGFKVNSGEYKLMGLAPYGQPVYVDAILNKLIDVKPDGSFRMNMQYFNYCAGLTMTSTAFHRLFGGPPRRPESNLEQRFLDLAASIQSVTEFIVLRMCEDLHRRTGMKALTLAGGVALNCVANGRLLREGPFEKIWVQPAAGDAGGALGAALFVWHQLLDRPRQPQPGDSQSGSLLGPKFETSVVRNFLNQERIPYEHIEAEDELLERVAWLLADGKIIGWFQGRMEYGPRALGARSILGDPRSPRMQSVMNLKIKYRESFRPFAPSVLREHVNEWFDMKPGQESPYMLLVAPVQQQRRTPIADGDRALMEHDPDLFRRVNIARSEIPAITHVDYSARIQTADAERNPRFTALLQAFYKLTGCPVLVNTSFNVRGEPIVCSPQDAYQCFKATEIDVLVLENCLLQRCSNSDAHFDSSERAAHLSRFVLD